MSQPTAPPPPPPPPGGGDGRDVVDADRPPGGGGTQEPGTGAELPLVRRTGDRVVAGVAAGLAQRWGIDPVLVRILFVVGAFAAGIGLVVYALLWISLPLVDEGAPVRTRVVPRRGAAFWIGAAVVTIGGILALAELPAPRILVPVALITLGVALWQRPGSSPDAPGATTLPAPSGDPAGGADRREGAAPSAAVPAGGPDATPAGWEPPPVPGRGQAAVAGTGLAPASASAPARPVRWWVPPRPRPRPSWLGPITVAVALVATGVVALLGEVGVLAPTTRDLLAVAVLVLGGGMVVGAVRGRAKWLAWPATALAVLVAVGGVDVPLRFIGDATVGEQHLAPSDLDGTLNVLQPVGLVTVDLADTAIEDGDRVEVAVGAGAIRVRVPDDVDVAVTGEVRVGDLDTVAPLDPPDPSARHVVARLRPDGGQERFAYLLPAAVPTGRTLHLEFNGGLLDDVEVLRGVEAWRLRARGLTTIDPPDERGRDDLFVPDDWAGGDWFLEAGTSSPDADPPTVELDLGEGGSVEVPLPPGPTPRPEWWHDEPDDAPTGAGRAGSGTLDHDAGGS